MRLFRPLLRLLAGAGGRLTLPRDGLDARDVFPQRANLLQALRLSHVELELQAEELVIELAFLVLELDVGQVADLFSLHKVFCRDVACNVSMLET